MIRLAVLSNRHRIGFTLAELLIALAILGVIATFTIPKILQTQQNSQWNAVTMEAAEIFAGAFQSYKLANVVDANSHPGNLTPYINYVNVDTSTTIDSWYWGTTISCGDPGRFCLTLHSGAKLWLSNTDFEGTANTNMINMVIDPDGKVTTDGSACSKGKSTMLFLYFTGRMTSYGNCVAGTTTDGWVPTCPPTGSCGPDPDYLDWKP